MNTFNVARIINDGYSVNHYMKFTLKKSYIQIHNNFYINPNFDGIVNINKVLDIDGSCTLTSVKVLVNAIINTNGYMLVRKFNHIFPGSFINSSVHKCQPEWDNMLINGYVMHNGVLS